MQLCLKLLIGFKQRIWTSVFYPLWCSVVHSIKCYQTFIMCENCIGSLWPCICLMHLNSPPHGIRGWFQDFSFQCNSMGVHVADNTLVLISLQWIMGHSKIILCHSVVSTAFENGCDVCIKYDFWRVIFGTEIGRDEHDEWHYSRVGLLLCAIFWCKFVPCLSKVPNFYSIQSEI